MLFPKCPKCNGDSERDGDSTIERQLRNASQTVWRMPPRMPFKGLVHLGLGVAKLGYTAIKWTPGIGGWRCKECKHSFKT